jgi:hypothetical protein
VLHAVIRRYIEQRHTEVVDAIQNDRFAAGAILPRPEGSLKDEV